MFILADIEILPPDSVVESISYWQKLIGGLVAFLPTILIAAVVLIVGLLLSKLIVKIMMRGLERSKLDKTAHGFLKSLVQIVLYTLVIVIALSTLGVPMTSIVTVIGAAGLAVGLALQSSLSNLAGGFIILLSKPFKVGDYIETNAVSGTVQHITILSTKLLTPDNKSVYIPNGQISGNKLINFTEEALRRLDMNFAIAYKDDYEVAKNIISDIVAKHPLALSTPEAFVRMSEHDQNAIIITARIWVASENYWALHFDMLERVKSGFDAAGISIPFQQLDVMIENKH